MKYKVKIKRYLFWKTFTVIGHSYDKDCNRMDFYLEDGGIISYGNWSKYDLKLGQDWALAVKKQMEKESGQNVNLALT